MKLKREPRLVWRPFVLLAALLVVLGFAAASGQLVVKGYANSNDFEVKWSSASCQEYHTWPSLTPSGPDFGEYLGKNVGATTITGVWSDTLNLTISGSYPSYAIECAVKYKNKGSMSIEAQSITLTPLSGVSGCSITGSTDDKTLSCAQLSVVLQDGLPDSCLQPAQEHESRLFTHVEQPAAENETMTYKLEIHFAQCGVVGPGGEPDCALHAVYNGKTVANGKTTYSYTLSGGGSTCEDLDYFKLPVRFNPKKTSQGGCVYAETHPGHWSYTPLTSTNPDYVKWSADNSVGSGPGSWTFTFTVIGTNIPTEQVQARVSVGGDAGDAGLVTVPKFTSCH